MLSLNLIIFALLLAAASGVPGLFLRGRAAGGDRISVAIMGVSSLTGVVGAIIALVGSGAPVERFFRWPAIGGGLVGADLLSAFFLMPIFLIGGIGAVYSLTYRPFSQYSGSAVVMRLCWGLIVAGMALLVIAKHALVFLLGWEVMALAAFFLIVVGGDEKSRRAGWVYLVASHLSTLILLMLFVIWNKLSGSFMLALPEGMVLSARMSALVYTLIMVGFGLKAGIMPLHFWLPGAHANAPSHVSAIMSGVVLKMGVYGLVRWLLVLPTPPSLFGAVVFSLGGVSALLGIAFAIAQKDLKRLLAYSSVENIGIITLGVGLAAMGMSASKPQWVALGLAGALLHVWNHSLFKPLLFLCAGNIDMLTGTRQLNLLGGLSRRMPWTASLFLIGALAISGLPPLNGFISELYIYIGMAKSSHFGGWRPLVALGVPLLGMAGALAVACFVKAYSMIFLGTPRSDIVLPKESEAPLPQRWPLLMLAVVCVAVGAVPAASAPVLRKMVALSSPRFPEIGAELGVIPFWRLTALFALLSTLVVWMLATLTRRPNTRYGPTWGCGYAAPTARMQYTASSFGRIIVHLSRSFLKPREKPPRIEGAFPAPSTAESDVDDAVLDRVIVPAASHAENWFAWFHRFHRGVVQHYLLYLLVALILLLAWSLIGVRS